MSKALERSYDGIIIGAGHHGLGLDILLVDRRLQYGDGLCTEQVTVPGFSTINLEA